MKVFLANCASQPASAMARVEGEGDGDGESGVSHMRGRMVSLDFSLCTALAQLRQADLERFVSRRSFRP